MGILNLSRYFKPQVRFIPRDETTERLYRLEHERNALIEKAAREQMKILGIDRKDFWTRGLALALLDVLESWDQKASQTAARAFLDLHAHKEDGDCSVFLSESGVCEVCGVARGEACPSCGGRSFHAEGCERLLGERKEEISTVAGLSAIVAVLLEALRPLAQEVTADDFQCHRGFCSAEECSRCGPILRARKAIALCAVKE